MSKEIQRLRQLDRRASVYDTYAATKEQQHSQLAGEISNFESLEDILPIAEQMAKAKRRTESAKRKSEEVQLKYSKEVHNVEEGLNKLAKLSEIDPALRPIYDSRLSELINYVGTQYRRPVESSKKTTETPQTPVEVVKPKDRKETKAVKDSEIYLRFQNGKEVTTRRSHHALMLRKLIQRGKTSSELTRELLGIDTPENRRSLTRHIVPKAKKFAGQNGYEVLNKEGKYRLKMLRTIIQEEGTPKKTSVSEQEQKIKEEKTPRKILGRIRIVPVPASLIDGDSEQKQKQEAKAHMTTSNEGRPKLTKESKKTLTIFRHEIEIQGAKNIEVMEHILDGFYLVGDLAELTYSENTAKTRNRIAPIIFGLNKRYLNPLGLTVENTNATNHRLPASYQPRLLTEEAAQSVKSSHSLALAPVSVTEVPYAPTEEEIRTEEETRVVEKIVNLLFKSRRIDFAALQTSLRTNERIKNMHGQRMYHPYKIEEVKKLFESGVRKLREESASVNLKSKWTDSDAIAWQQTERQIKMLAESDFAEYIRIVKRKLDKALQEFEEMSGRVPEWLKMQ